MRTPKWHVNRASLFERLTVVLAVYFLVVTFIVLWPQLARAQEREPIAASGHGGFFDQSGQQIPLTLSFAAKAQAWYRTKLLTELSAGKKREFAAYKKRLHAGLDIDGQDLLLMQHQELEWLLANAKSADLKLKTAGKLRALRYAMNWKLPEQGSLKIVEKREVFTPGPDVLKRLESPQLKPAGDVRPLSITINKGQDYIDECRLAGVPIPPTINVMDPAGLAGWKSEGFLARTVATPEAPTAVFIEGTPAEVRTYRSTSPEGMCYALPRYTDASLRTVELDGVICMGKQSSKVCFWDNQWTVDGTIKGFDFPADEQIPIGVPNTPGGKYQAGGKEIENGPGNICTDCHAGENPFIVHPKFNFGNDEAPVLWESLSGPPPKLPSMPVYRYDPIVAESWPQNRFSQAGSTVPPECGGSCHVKGGSAGRFPHLSEKLPQYCTTILAQAITRTMPPFNPGVAAATANAFKDEWCNEPPDSSSADVGDPHITTTNGIPYDFQAAGEFTVLKNEDTSFELQTRQSPVLTHFTPLANAYTGLASCVSLNTAVALRVGKRRITYQTAGEASDNTKQLQLRVDGKPVDPASGFNLGGGNVINKTTADGEIDIRLADGTRIVVTPLLWAGYWYLDLQVFNTPAREGVMGHILTKDWLPRAPDGSSFGPKPASLLDRHMLLNKKFANAWRVSSNTSLFNYDGGASTADFTDVNWPPESGKLCTSTTVRGPTPIVKEPRPDIAKKACRGIKDKTIYANCIFDVTVMGDTVFAKGYRRADRLRARQ